MQIPYIQTPKKMEGPIKPIEDLYNITSGAFNTLRNNIILYGEINYTLSANSSGGTTITLGYNGSQEPLSNGFSISRDVYDAAKKAVDSALGIHPSIECFIPSQKFGEESKKELTVIVNSNGKPVKSTVANEDSIQAFLIAYLNVIEELYLPHNYHLLIEDAVRRCTGDISRRLG